VFIETLLVLSDKTRTLNLFYVHEIYSLIISFVTKIFISVSCLMKYLHTLKCINQVLSLEYVLIYILFYMLKKNLTERMIHLCSGTFD